MIDDLSKYSSCETLDVDIDLETDTINVRELKMEQQPSGAQDKIGLTGHVCITLRDTITGKIKEQIEMKNLVVTTGKVWLAQRLNDETVNNQSHVAIGTSNQAPAAGDTGLVGTQVARVAATKTRTSNAVKFSAQYVAGVGTSSTINEAGIFDGSSGTVMLARVITPSTINKTSTDELNIDWTITVS